MRIVEALTRLSARDVAVARERESARSASVQDEVAAHHDRYRAPLFRYLRSLGLPDPDSEEVLQDVFLALFRHLIAGKPEQNLQAWLFTVARNFALKRHGQRKDELELSWAADVFDRSPNPEEHVVRAQQMNRVAAVVRALPEQDRECLVLRSEGLRYRDIAAMQGRSLGAVALAIKRSLARVAESAGR